MKKKILTSTTAVFVALSGTAWVAAQSADSSQRNADHGQTQDRQSQNSREGRQGQNPTAPNGYVLLEENTVYMMAREPQQHLLRAREQLEANNPKAAAAEIRLAEAYLKMQEARPGDQGKDVLSHWQQKLNDLAGRVEKGDVKSHDMIHTANGANYALAKYFDERAKDEIGDQHKQVQAGYDLEAAADCFEQSMLWSNPSSAQQGQHAQDSQLQQQDVQAIADARAAADRMISAENLASNGSDQQGEAQLAAGKTGPGHEQQNQGSANAQSGNSGSSQNAQQAVNELGKAIDARGSAFKSDSNDSGSQHSNRGAK